VSTQPRMVTSAERLRRLLALVPYVATRRVVSLPETARTFGMTERELIDDLNLAWCVELRAPELPTLRVLLPLWPTWLSYPVSYLFIAIVWTNHHYVLCNASEATPRLLWFKRWARVTKAKAALQGVLVTPPGSTR